MVGTGELPGPKQPGRNSQRLLAVLQCPLSVGNAAQLAPGRCKFDVRSWTLIYYTGKRKLAVGCDLPPTVLIFNGRPSLEV